MNNICGFAHIRKNSTSCKGTDNPKDFEDQICPVFEFGVDDCVLVLNPAGNALAMFDKEDIQRKFRCGYVSGIVTPPELDTFNQMSYVAKAQTRKGGYNYILCNMVIEASLRNGKFTDSFLWELQ